MHLVPQETAHLQASCYTKTTISRQRRYVDHSQSSILGNVESVSLNIVCDPLTRHANVTLNITLWNENSSSYTWREGGRKDFLLHYSSDPKDKQYRKGMYKWYTEICSQNHCCSGKAISTTYSERVSYSPCKMHGLYYIVVCGLSGSTLSFHFIFWRVQFS